ncbi:F-box/LRR-repeat protein [Actinidia chinensis var. chinensis]|uniref:F-box/LRR-repeat protein n=1 Tax=Actinidia chinensis var. chinensis TaxID=1590841 RepID=A0A2R6P766_ACTCC|nr:F-box/LRR-repeat protein [Actinidia chinensis var. chinensis]
MEYLPVEVIGNILSRLEAARDVLIASATCRKWRQARHKHLHTLSFSSADRPFDCLFSTSKLEILITETILQTTGIQDLYILMDQVYGFSAATVIAWLMYTRNTLRHLAYNVRTSSNVNFLDIFRRQKLEILVLANNTIREVEPHYHRFPFLKSVSLSYIRISATDLNLLLSTCPEIENLALVNPEITMSDDQFSAELSSPTLKRIYVKAVRLGKIRLQLEADSLEALYLKDCDLECFEFFGKGTLKCFKIDYVNLVQLDMGETMGNLAIVDVSNFTIMWSKFYQMISKSPKLRRLRLWDVVFGDEVNEVALEWLECNYPLWKSRAKPKGPTHGNNCSVPFADNC